MRKLTYVCGDVVVNTLAEAQKLPFYEVQVTEIREPLNELDKELARKRIACRNKGRD